MSAFTVRQGLDLPLAGKPVQEIEPGATVRSVGLVGRDYLGLRPSMEVAEGDRVTLGQPLFTDKQDPDVKYTSPGTGTVESINRGARRILQSVVVRLDADADAAEADSQLVEPVASGDLAGLDATAAREALCKSGLWTAPH